MNYDHHDPDANRPALDAPAIIQALESLAAECTLGSGIPHACQQAVEALRRVQAMAGQAEEEHAEHLDNHARRCLANDHLVTSGIMSEYDGPTASQFLRIFKGSEEIR